MAGSQARAQWPGPERVPRDLALRGVPTPLHHTQDSSLTSQILSPLKFPLFLFFCLFLCFPGPSSPCALSAEVRSAAPILSLVSPSAPLQDKRLRVSRTMAIPSFSGVWRGCPLAEGSPEGPAAAGRAWPHCGGTVQTLCRGQDPGHGCRWENLGWA